MTLPGHSVVIGSRPAAQAAAPSTANGFMVGFTERGPADKPVLVASLTQAVDTFGGRIANGAIYDALDVAFREGASAIYVGRIVGPAPVLATKTFAAASGNAFRTDALSYGVWGNSISVGVTVTGGTFVITVQFGGVTVETSPALNTNDEAVTWGAASKYIRVVKLSANNPITAAIGALTGGTDDNTNAVDLQRQNALALFARDLGPGQVSAPGITTSQAYLDLLAHAAANNRRALLDGVDTSTVATLTAASTALRTAPGNAARYGQFLAPWAIVPGLTPGTTRTVPYSAVQTGLIARAEGEGANPNQAAAGKRGRTRYVIDRSQPPWTDAQREQLNDAGVTVARKVRSTVTTYGNRSLTNPLTDGDWKSFSASRLMMAIAAGADKVMEDYDFEQIDGKGNIFKKLEGDLSGLVCIPLYTAGALFGETPEQAFNVNTGPDVNTPSTIQAEEIHAQIGARVSPTGEVLVTEVVKVPISEAL